MDNKRKICVSVGEKTPVAALATATSVVGADVIEIRLDYLTDSDATVFCEQVSTDLLFTCRPQWEGGLFIGDEEERLAILTKAVECGAVYIDVELEAPESTHQSLLGSIKKNERKTKLILSNHDFETTPRYSQLIQKVEAMRDKNAYIGKLITTARNPSDVITIFKIIDYARVINFPLIAFCMGEAGAVSRVSTCDVGGFMTYCSCDGKEVTAPGQISVGQMREIFARFP